jgi:hypothetical protein
MSEFNLSDPANEFHAVIRRHNADATRLGSWRRTFRDHADDLTAFFRTFPGTGHFEERHVRHCFSGLTSHHHQGGPTVFDPWTSWWDGTWHGLWNGRESNSDQYHIWDETGAVGGQSIQPVTQSVHRFVSQANLTAGVAANQVDLGINVWSSGAGITGWVSKRQFGAVELPHVGYSLDPQTLIWITQPDFAGVYYMFFEWVYASRGLYGIHGRTFEITRSRVIDRGMAGWAEYHRATPAPAPSPATPAASPGR